MSNKENIIISSYGVAYPGKEHAYAFVPNDSVPFTSAVIGITNPTPSYEMQRENARICLFEYVLEGEGEILLDGEWIKAAAGDFYILPAGIDHVYRSSKAAPWKKLWVNLDSGYMPSLLSSYGITGGVFHSNGARVYFEELFALPKSDHPTIDIYYEITARLEKIVAVASRLARENRGMINVISKYIYKKTTLDEIARELHLSKSSLIRSFRKKHGATPYEYLIELRIQSAKILLRDTSLSIKEIADKLAFTDEHYFSSKFLERVGTRPTAYRKESARHLFAKESV